MKKEIIKTIRIYNQDVGMELDIEKCTMLKIKKMGKAKKRERIDLVL